MTPLFSLANSRGLRRLRRFIGWPQEVKLVIMVADKATKLAYEAELARLGVPHIEVQCINSLKNGSELTILGIDEASKL